MHKNISVEDAIKILITYSILREHSTLFLINAVIPIEIISNGKISSLGLSDKIAQTYV